MCVLTSLFAGDVCVVFEGQQLETRLQLAHTDRRVLERASFLLLHERQGFFLVSHLQDNKAARQVRKRELP